MNSTEISEIIESFDNLSLEDKVFTYKILEKNITESKREQLIQRVKEAKANYSAGATKQGDLKALYDDLLLVR